MGGIPGNDVSGNRLRRAVALHSAGGFTDTLTARQARFDRLQLYPIPP
jgi:hypothetical protein